MATAPYGVRLLVGAATVAVEETMKLPKTILMYPMTLASQAAHLVMRFQQNLAELAIKGDSTLENIFPPKDEQPEWATFDEDLAGEVEAPGPAQGGVGDGDRRTEGRFALYSLADAASDAAPLKQGRKSADTPSVPQPSVVAELDYTALTLAQLRARLQSLSVDELEALLAYEQATKARAPFQTLLANRITRANAK
ncbi:lipid droplet-associated protein [Mycobacterium sp. HNNTM2301]|uniref:lipid droplet-associated protein n=1 Tax=Mycobacterium hainanense TaxID=3289775 RepID=UPI0035A62736